MNYLDRIDDKFIAEATDDSMRRRNITRLRSARLITLVTALFTSLLFLVVTFYALFSHISGGAIGAVCLAFGSVMQWMLVMKHESDLRLLKLAEKLKIGL